MREVKIYLWDMRKLSIDSLLSLLGESEINRFNNVLNIDVKKERICSYFLKKKYIGEYYLDENEKPKSKDIEFNISHSHGVIVIATSNIPIGIDIEKIKEVKQSLKDYICSEKEIEYCVNDEKFFEIWTNKESLVKCIGIGLREKVDSIPGLPISGVREYKGRVYRSKTIKYQDFILSITCLGDEEYDVNLEEIEQI